MKWTVVRTATYSTTNTYDAFTVLRIYAVKVCHIIYVHNEFVVARVAGRAPSKTIRCDISWAECPPIYNGRRSNLIFCPLRRQSLSLLEHAFCYFAVVQFNPLASQINCSLLYLSSASIFKALQCRSKFVKMLSECQTAWFRMRRRVTRRLIWIQAVCI